MTESGTHFSIRKPSLVVHADWGLNPRKRWQSQARLIDGRYQIRAPEPVGKPDEWLEQLRKEAAGNGPILLGLDLPLGLPLAYAQRAGVTDFVSLLPRLGEGDWAAFYRPATTATEISLARPFYPFRPGGTKQQHLLDGLGVASLDHLRRVCDRGHPQRRPASSLFWTLGAQQVGKAAISAWRDVLGPAVRQRDDVELWPFAGPLETLLQDGRIVVAECYPAEFYVHLGLEFPRGPDGRGGKRVQASRAAAARPLFDWATASDVELTPALRATLHDGFGPKAAGEDRFDAVVGVVGMLNVVLGRREAGWPADPAVQRIEGWILGQVWR